LRVARCEKRVVAAAEAWATTYMGGVMGGNQDHGRENLALSRLLTALQNLQVARSNALKEHTDKP